MSLRFLVRKRRQARRVIIVALIDILIVLVIFLVVTTSFKQQPPSSSPCLNPRKPSRRGLMKKRRCSSASIPRAICGSGPSQTGDADRLKEDLIAAASARPNLKLAINADKLALLGRL